MGRTPHTCFCARALCAPAVAGPLAVACLLALAGAQPAAAEPVALAGAPGESTPGLLSSSPPGPALSAASPPTGSGTRARAPASSGQSTSAGAPIPVAASDTPPAGRRLSSNQVLAIAQALPKMKALRRKHAGSFADAYLKLPFRWQVSFFSRGGKKEIGQVIIDDASGRVLEQWTGFQVAWTMARGYPGAFGRHVNALYVWLPLCALFLLPFINPRRPFALLHLDLLVLLSFSVSLAFFNHGRIYASTPLVYPPLLYLLGRMLWLSRPGRAHTDRPRGSSGAGPRMLSPAPWLALGVVFLLGFRIALNVTDSNVIDVGYAGVIGAQRIVDGKPLYGSYPSDNEHGDTYGPANYEAYVPFQQIFGFSGHWDSLPAAHAAAIAFDLLAVVLIFLLGRRVRGPTLGIALAYAWVAYPFTLFALECNSNDTLVGALAMAAVLVSYSLARGALSALAALTKFAPLALAPVLAMQGAWARQEPALPGHPGEGPLGDGVGAAQTPARARLRLRPLLTFVAGFAAAAALAFVPALTHASLHTFYDRTLAYQADRGSPFSIWGLYGGLRGLQLAVQIGAVALAVGLALVPGPRPLAALAAACAALLIATQLGIDHWFYLYIPWFVGLALVALLASVSPPEGATAAAASEPARSSRRAVALSSG